MIPPKPPSRARDVSLWGYLKLFRQDILSAQPERLYGAWMAEFKAPFFRSYLVNDPKLLRLVLNERPRDFLKSQQMTEGLRLLLGDGLFVTNGALWERQRRIVAPAFDAARLRMSFAPMLAASEAACDRLAPGEVTLDAWASHAAADVIFRTLFSVPIEDEMAMGIFSAFQRYQGTQPLINLGLFFRLPGWVPRMHRRAAKRAARDIRARIEGLVADRARAIAEGSAPDDLATWIMTTPDPNTGEMFGEAEMVDQVATIFLAGHESSAAALAWALYLLATHPDAQARVAEEADGFLADPTFERLNQLPFTRDVVRETLRLYPPVPMILRETAKRETFRDRAVPQGAQVVISPWHLHRHTRIWSDPDHFRPERWQDEDQRQAIREAYLPFSSGPRVCPGAGFAMAEATILLAVVAARWRIASGGVPPVPSAHLTVRSRNGIKVAFSAR
jgi:cytochrome P450